MFQQGRACSEPRQDGPWLVRSSLRMDDRRLGRRQICWRGRAAIHGLRASILRRLRCPAEGLDEATTQLRKDANLILGGIGAGKKADPEPVRESLCFRVVTPFLSSDFQQGDRSHRYLRYPDYGSDESHCDRPRPPDLPDQMDWAGGGTPYE